MLIALGATSWVVGFTVAAFTALSGVCCLFLLLINILNKQPFNYVSILAVLIALDKFNAFAQQLYTMFNFQPLMLEIFRMVMDFFECRGTDPLPLFTAPNEMVSVFFSIQQYLVNTQGLLFFYWSMVLFASSWSLSRQWWKNKKFITGTKISCFVLPGIQGGLLRIPAIRDNDWATMMIMNVMILITIGMSCIFLALTLLHVISVQRDARGTKVVRLSETYDGVVEYRPRDTIIGEKIPRKTMKTLSGTLKVAVCGSDSWLVARIVLAFVMVEGLSIYLILMQIFYLQRWIHFKSEWRQGLSAPDVDESEQFANLCSPIPSGLTGYLFLLVFGTTAQSRAQVHNIFRLIFCCISRKKGLGYNNLSSTPAPSVPNFKPFATPRPRRPSGVITPNSYATLSPAPLTPIIFTNSPRVHTPVITASPRVPSSSAGFDFQFPPQSRNSSDSKVSSMESMSLRASSNSSQALASLVRIYTPVRPDIPVAFPSPMHTPVWVQNRSPLPSPLHAVRYSPEGRDVESAGAGHVEPLGNGYSGTVF